MESIIARYPDQIFCRPGCASCCVGGLTLCAVEAVALGEGLGIERDRVHLQAGQSPLHADGQCAFLDADTLCRVHAHRPLICRTQGMPLLHPDSEGVSTCELNFRSLDPHPTAVVHMENLETTLFAANLTYCRTAGLHPMVRMPMDRLAQLSGIID
ncbi:MAG TPA: YkgJ family cysteine cluster protein [Polyangia bacterium]|nr:YkgJ family cysteine cluster protein [Polyangia bacterium]